jgi:hypothetical protein
MPRLDVVVYSEGGVGGLKTGNPSTSLLHDQGETNV